MTVPRRFRPSIVLLATLSLGGGRLVAQQPDGASSLRRAVERIDRNATVRFAARGKRPVSGSITRLTADSVYVQGFDWPVGVPLARVDTVWEHVGGNDASVHRGFLVGGALGAVLGTILAGSLCEGFDESADRSCGRDALWGAFGGGLFFGMVGGTIGGLSSAGPRWEQRWP